MSIDQLKFKIIDEMCGYTFTYKGEPCGMEPTVENGVFTFDAWYDDRNKNLYSIDDLMTDKFFGGKSMAQLIDDIELDFI